MTLQDFMAFHPPGLLSTGEGLRDTNIAATINASGEAFACFFQAPATGNIQKIWIRTNTVASSETIRGGLQGVDASGNPDGTWMNSGNGFVDVSVSTSGTWQQFDLTTNKVAVTYGTTEAFVVFEAGPSWVSGDIDFARPQKLFFHGAAGLPYNAEDTGAGWPGSTKTQEGACLVLEYDDGKCYFIQNWWAGEHLGSGGSVALDGTPGAAGLKFELLSEIAIDGIILSMEFNNDDFKLIHYTSAQNPGGGTDLIATSWDGDVEGKDNDAGKYFKFDSPLTLAAGVHRITVKPDSTGSPHVVVNQIAVDQTQFKGALGIPHSALTNWAWTQENGASWADTADRLPDGVLCVTQVHDGAGGGAGTDSVLGGGNLNGGFAA